MMHQPVVINTCGIFQQHNYGSAAVIISHNAIACRTPHPCALPLQVCAYQEEKGGEQQPQPLQPQFDLHLQLLRKDMEIMELTLINKIEQQAAANRLETQQQAAANRLETQQQAAANRLDNQQQAAANRVEIQRLQWAVICLVLVAAVVGLKDVLPLLKAIAT
jgi:hypothetical protein